MASAFNSRATKAQLVGRIYALDTHIGEQAHEIASLREQLSMARSAPTLPQGRATHAAYYAYVAKQRLVARTTGQRVVSYKAYGDWATSMG